MLLSEILILLSLFDQSFVLSPHGSLIGTFWFIQTEPQLIVGSFFCYWFVEYFSFVWIWVIVLALLLGIEFASRSSISKLLKLRKKLQFILNLLSCVSLSNLNCGLICGLVALLIPWYDHKWLWWIVLALLFGIEFASRGSNKQRKLLNLRKKLQSIVNFPSSFELRFDMWLRLHCWLQFDNISYIWSRKEFGSDL